MTRRIENELRQALGHVQYEFEMLQVATMLVGLGLLAGDHNAVLESLLTHMRNLRG